MSAFHLETTIVVTTYLCILATCVMLMFFFAIRIVNDTPNKVIRVGIMSLTLLATSIVVYAVLWVYTHPFNAVLM